MVASVEPEKSKLKIIIVEDDEALRTVLARVLSHLGHDVRSACDGVALDSALADYPADVVVLDLNLPGEDGVDIARRLRRTNNCGIIMTTGRGLVKERVSGFQSGADLYFVKPVDPMELHEAISNLGRRLAQSPPSSIVWHLDPSSSILRTPRNISIKLTSNECIVLKLLFASPGETVRSSDIFLALGHPDDEYGGMRVKALFSRLRKKVKSLDTESELPISARHSLGYAFLAT